jgi:pimeloyl-ACP methyl ester carboxylesterase
MERIATKLGPLHVERHGRGPAVICWPSLFCDVRTLRPLVDELARDHRLLLVDGPGHGGSGGPTRPFTMEDCADAAMTVLDDEGIARAAWIGSAWGGHVGAVAAIRHPDRLLGLAVMNSPMAAWTGRPRALNAFVYWTLRALGRPRALVRSVAEAMIAPARRAERPELVEPIVDCMLVSPRAPFLAAVRSAMLDRPSLVPRLGGIRVPTLFVTGENDPLFPVDAARAQAASIPDVRFEVVPGTAHLSVWEAPERVLPRLRAFLAEIGAGDGPASARSLPA